MSQIFPISVSKMGKQKLESTVDCLQASSARELLKGHHARQVWWLALVVPYTGEA